MQLLPLSPRQAEAVYRDHLVRDFPAEEVKPFSDIAHLSQQGRYVCYGGFEGEALKGYAFLARDCAAPYLLLDYFAACAPCRGQGVGSALLGLLAQNLSAYAGVLAEVERPTCAADPAERDLRERRIAFYLRNGFRRTQVRATLFSVPYELLYLPLSADPGDAALRGRLDALYRGILSPWAYEHRCELSPL